MAPVRPSHAVWARDKDALLEGLIVAREAFLAGNMP
jgi:hypothetical protein